jgi:hypothetical protein
MVVAFAAGPRAVALAQRALVGAAGHHDHGGSGAAVAQPEVHDIASAAWSVPASDADGLAHDGLLDRLLRREQLVLLVLDPLHLPASSASRQPAVDHQQRNTDDEWLDVHTERIYTVALAVARAGVAAAAPLRVVLVSSMAVFERVDDALSIMPGWRRRPSTSPHSLAPALAELVLEEFARWQPHGQKPRPGEQQAEGSIRLSVLRLGTVIDPPPCSSTSASDVAVPPG